MTNGEKYRTAKERAEAFRDWCLERPCGTCELIGTSPCALYWLDLEAPAEEPLPCPFCGAKTSVIEHPDTGACWVLCENSECHYSSCYADTEESAISAHNRVARSAAKGHDFLGESEVAK